MMKYQYLYILLITAFLIFLTVNLQRVSGSIKSFYPDHLDGPFTGGFGEESCHSCHFDYDLNHPEGKLEIRGLKSAYEPGRAYEFEIVLTRDDMLKAGFQLTARFEDGSQAGNFEPGDSLAFTPGLGGDVRYLQHAVGRTSVRNGAKRWTITWIAPGERSGDVVFNIAANAANGDRSEFGDWIYVKEVRIGE